MNYLKQAGLLILYITLSVSSQAQTSTDNCKPARAAVPKYLKEKNYQEAAYYWQMAVKECGKEGLDRALYVNGKIAYKGLLSIAEKAKDTDRIGVLTDTLVWIYKGKMELENDPVWTEAYANFLYRYKHDESNLIDSLYTLLVNQLHEKSKSYSLYRSLRVKLQIHQGMTGEKDVYRTELIQHYFELSEHGLMALEQQIDQKKKEEYETALNKMDGYLQSVIKDCADLDAILSERLNDPSKEMKATEIKRALSLYDKRKCELSDTYLSLMAELLELEPSAKSYPLVGIGYYKKKDYSKSTEAFKKALEFELEPQQQNEYLLDLGKSQMAVKQYKKAFETFKKVKGELEAEALYLIAQMIASDVSKCGDSSFERKSAYWLANKYVNLAIDKGLKNVDRRKYMDKAPNGEEVFNEGLQEGDEILIHYWNEKTLIRF
jgi:tetratricopeptide (TPR) repeat protein